MMPPSPRGSVQEQLVRQYSYLFQMAQQLNVALGQLGEARDCRTLRRHCGPGGGAGAAVSDPEEYDRQDGGHGAAAYGISFRPS